MDLLRLIEGLSDPAAYPHPVDTVEVRQTHISVVFLAGAFAYKVKKPVALGFLDFRTLEQRRHFAEEEVRLNRRLAPGIYLSVVPVAQAEDRLTIGGAGEVVDWAVQMVRLPDEAMLQARLERGEVDAATIASLARRLAAFHAAAEAGDRIAAFGRPEVVAGNLRENFAQAEPLLGAALSRPVLDRLAALSEMALAALRPTLAARAARGVPRDTHGDLRLEHVYLLAEKGQPEDFVIIDCIEFNERFRFADPIADMAFLVMELEWSGRRDLARVFTESYLAASGDAEGRALVSFYAAYRAAVRGKVEGMKALEAEVPEAERSAALGRSRGLWLLALGMLERPERRPGLVLVGGLPGTGKSTLARALAERAGFEVIRSDVVRKELAAAVRLSGPAAFEEGIYTPAWTDRTYAACLDRAGAWLYEGRRVLVDATFRAESWRQRFLETARRWGVPGVLLVCQANPTVARRRLEARRDDASEATSAVYEEAARRWEDFGAASRPALHLLPTDDPRQPALDQALAALAEHGLGEAA
ncbi:MAG: AAA family ATPase [Isosphaeraceae bacterium]|nr:AAA family ATPase [Isosphaeraceae bacterium]